MGKDWDGVATAIRARMDELDMTQAELAHRAGVSLMTVRELQQNLRPRRRAPRTLSAVSAALGLPPDHLSAVLAGEDPPDPDQDDPVLTELDEIKDALIAVHRRLDVIEQQLAAAGGPPEVDVHGRTRRP